MKSGHFNLLTTALKVRAGDSNDRELFVEPESKARIAPGNNQQSQGHDVHLAPRPSASCSSWQPMRR
jgi:hypothetical protein